VKIIALYSFSKSRRRLYRLLEKFKTRYDYIFLDCPLTHARPNSNGAMAFSRLWNEIKPDILKVPSHGH
jgi:cellulose biosynthesis protein BcsQ